MNRDGENASSSHVGRKMLSGTLWMVSMRWTIRLIGLVNTAIIARLLVPADFGLVALSMILVDLLITVTDGDIEMALVRAPEMERERQHTGWTLKIFAGILTWAVIAGVVAHHVVLTALIASRRRLFAVRTFWIYFGSTFITAAGLVVAVWAIARNDRDFALGVLVALAVLYPLRELYLGAKGRQEVTEHRVTLFKRGRKP